MAINELTDQEKIDEALFKTRKDILRLWASADSVNEIKYAWLIVAKHFDVVSVPTKGEIGGRPRCQLLKR